MNLIVHTATLVFVVLFGWAPPALAAQQRPQGQNCDVSQPPAGAGEEAGRGADLRVYPRARDIGAAYTGCQALFLRQGDRWVIVSLTEVVSGDPVRLWSPHETDARRLACRFRAGKLVAGDAKACPHPQSLLRKSFAPGCMRRMQEQKAAGVPPAGCSYE